MSVLVHLNLTISLKNKIRLDSFPYDHDTDVPPQKSKQTNQENHKRKNTYFRAIVHSEITTQIVGVTDIKAKTLTVVLNF